MTKIFEPHRWFRNRHIQTCLPTLLARMTPALPFAMEPIYLPDGDLIELGRLGQLDAPAILLMPGLEGDVTSPYIQSVSRALSAAGWQVLVMHYRTCGNTINLQAKSYNSYNYDDLHFFLDDIKQKFNLQPEIAIGFSMGGNLLLHYARHYPKAFKQMITISTPFDMHETAKYLPRVYEKRFLQSFKGKIKRKLKLGVDLPAGRRELKRVKSLFDFDRFFTAPIFGHASAEEYYDYSSCAPFLADIATPTHMIFAEDDPFIPSHSIPEDLNAPHVTLEIHKEGGHVGFLAHKNSEGNPYWLAQRLIYLLQHEFSLSPT